MQQLKQKTQSNTVMNQPFKVLKVFKTVKIRDAAETTPYAMKDILGGGVCLSTLCISSDSSRYVSKGGSIV